MEFWISVLNEHWLSILLGTLALFMAGGWLNESENREMADVLRRFDAHLLLMREAEIEELRGDLAARDQVIAMLRAGKPIRVPLLLRDEDGDIAAQWPGIEPNIHIDDKT